jgi:hypothetical protein
VGQPHHADGCARPTNTRAPRKLNAIAAVTVSALALGFASAEARALSQRLELDVRARIAGRCGFADAPQDPHSVVRVDVAQRIAIPFTLDCNQPFIISVRSQNGGVSRVGDNSGNGFRALRTYNAHLEIDTDAGLRTTADCDSLALSDAHDALCEFSPNQSGGWSSGNATAIDRSARMLISWPDSSDGARFAAGDYSDVITITIGQAP